MSSTVAEGTAAPAGSVTTPLSEAAGNYLANQRHSREHGRKHRGKRDFSHHQLNLS